MERKKKSLKIKVSGCAVLHHLDDLHFQRDILNISIICSSECLPVLVSYHGTLS